MDDALVEFLVDHSPPDSGPVYFFLAENWSIISFGAQILLVGFVLLIAGFAFGAFLDLDDE